MNVVNDGGHQVSEQIGASLLVINDEILWYGFRFEKHQIKTRLDNFQFQIDFPSKDLAVDWYKVWLGREHRYV